MFTAAGILLLVEEGALSLDDPLTKFVPDFPVDPGDRITVRHLLNHTSGLVSFTDLPDHRSIMRHDLKHEEILARFQDKPSMFEPGEKFRYCNSGYYLLGMIIEAVAEQKYEPFLKERILDPLKLDATTYDRHLKVIPNRADGYARWGEDLVRAHYVSMKMPFAAGALASTAEDLIRWSRALTADQLLKPESFEAMTTAGKLNNGKSAPYGFGCFVGRLDGHRYFRHGGGIPGFVSEFVHFLDDELTVVVLTNAGRNSPRKIADQIAKVALIPVTPK
jgi:CubicO group peptidase (beta-lactamase class C family)